MDLFFRLFAGVPMNAMGTFPLIPLGCWLFPIGIWEQLLKEQKQAERGKQNREAGLIVRKQSAAP